MHVELPKISQKAVKHLSIFSGLHGAPTLSLHTGVGGDR